MGGAMVKISDVAALAGVSPSAVSRVLSGDSTLRVSEQTRARVLAAAQQLDYVPNHAGRSLRTSRSSTIALVVPDVTSAVFAELARGAEHEAAARGLAIVLGRSESMAESSAEGAEWLRRMVAEGRIDGVILQLPDDAPEVPALGATSAPVVVINSIADGPHSTIILDDAAGIRIAVDHLSGLGHERIGFVGGLPGSATGARREGGFRDALNDAGLAVDERWMTALGYTGSDGRAAIEELLRRGGLPSALVVANLNAALGVLAAIHARGLRVPNDVSIVALHDVWYADATWPPITTVRMPLGELGVAAVAHVAEGSNEVTHVVIETPAPQLMLRESTSRPSR